MGTEQVVEKILSDASKQAAEIKSQAAEKISAAQAELAGQISDYEKQTERLAEKNAEDEKSHILAAARMENAREFLVEKCRILDDVFEKSAENLKNLPDAEYKKLFADLMLAAVETGDEEVVVGKDETRIDESFVREVSGKLAHGYKNELHLSLQREKLSAGFILKRGKIKNNVSLEVLLVQARKELEIELAKELFVN
ncbi:MAG: V-type ATP synthase subunit E [Planctomycetes bacterium]|nr:V-type ATP synthase subunit E [Planctomycetota bacterium]